MRNYRGNPIITIRLEETQVEGLRRLANEQLTTVSEIIRTLVRQYLRENHVEARPRPLDGQIHV